MRRFVAFKFLFALLAFSACKQEITKPKPKPPKKKAEFKREVFDAGKYPALTAVGKVSIGLSRCSLTLVAEDIAISAGHCFMLSNIKFELNKKISPILTSVIFTSKNGEKIPDVRIERILKWKMDPDYAILKLNKKIPKDLIEPLEISDLKYAELLRETERLGCAGFNGDKGLGKKGRSLTISKNIKIYYKKSNSERIDTNCISTHGGSGGLFYEEKYNSETETNEYYFVGVIWGVTGDNFNMKGEPVNDREVITSITPVKVFKEELKKIIDKN